ncbi:putative phosphonate transport system ATP-binding protein [Dethiosulfatibacter aminovorans DSM 17477]|uniref:Putative phosphonate transport system ATP-binding protein n=1 Tax=Dethiosulfatibacter aminovorans DSM 17477 TaxID=1121476 RepID=A0A1M6AYT0_9FIRM|nr:ATP-binding cassette domain-containing protein [Dethiosulfatibacter aminovorans]SHI41616.1 putative phosphonate transport system ATP-binding protein [Dethiosulfatibacter aminovorans DSM 17477]
MLDFEDKVLRVRNLSKQFGEGCELCRHDKGVLEKNHCPHCKTIYACRDISFDLYKGEILGVVGESGSGKSTFVKCLYFDQDVTAGEAYVTDYKEGKANMFDETSQQKRYLRDYLLGMVYQNPYLGLKMDFTTISNIAEKLIAAGGRNVVGMIERADELLDVVSIEKFRRKDAPKSFSGGMQQRVQIAKALSNNPPILFLDEVTTGLDLSVQAAVLDMIKVIQRDLQISMIVVSHDLGVIRMLADRTMVMLDGVVIEEGLTDQILEDPQHAYTQQLVHSLL